MTATSQLIVRRSHSRLRSQRWYWTLKTNGRKVATSGEGYTDKDECIRMGKRVVSGDYAPFTLLYR